MSKPTHRPWFSIILGVAFTVVLAACASSSEAESDASTQTTEAPGEASSTTTSAQAPEDEADVDGTALLETGFGSLSAGTYRVEKLGSSFSFTVEQSNLFVQENSGSQLVLSPPNSQGPGDREMAFIQLSALPDPASPTTAGDDWPIDDFRGWLDSVNDVPISNREETTIDGLNATLVELDVSELGCCIRLGSKSLSGSIHRVWVIEREGEDPLAVVLGINNESDRGWIDAYENIASTLTFGSS